MARDRAMPQWEVGHRAPAVRSAPATAPAWAWKKTLSFFLSLLSVREFCQTFLLALFVLSVAGAFVRASAFSYYVSAESAALQGSDLKFSLCMQHQYYLLIRIRHQPVSRKEQMLPPYEPVLLSHKAVTHKSGKSI